MEKVGNAVPHPGTGSLLKNSVVASFLSYGIWPLKFTTGRDVPRGDAQDAHASPRIYLAPDPNPSFIKQ